jgi:hypothetical protein
MVSDLERVGVIREQPTAGVTARNYRNHALVRDWSSNGKGKEGN